MWVRRWARFNQSNNNVIKSFSEARTSKDDMVGLSSDMDVRKRLFTSFSLLRTRSAEALETGRPKQQKMLYNMQRRQSGLNSGGVVDPGQKILIFKENSGKILIFSGNLTNKKSIFQANFRKISIFYRYFHKNFQFFKANFGRISIF